MFLIDRVLYVDLFVLTLSFSYSLLTTLNNLNNSDS